MILLPLESIMVQERILIKVIWINLLLLLLLVNNSDVDAGGPIYLSLYTLFFICDGYRDYAKKNYWYIVLLKHMLPRINTFELIPKSPCEKFTSKFTFVCHIAEHSHDVWVLLTFFFKVLLSSFLICECVRLLKFFLFHLFI